MTATALPENYCVCVGEDGAPRELGRSGTAVTYKAMSYQSGRPVALQLIPLADVSEAGRAQFELKVRAVRKLKHPNVARVFDVREEDEHLVFASEFVQGETAERWVVTHGPMPPDAVLRVGLQVVSALAEAAFHSLSHRSIQPANLMLVSGAAPDGDWPFVKLLHFGLGGVKLYSDGKELVPAIGAAFASPEQLEKGKTDFRSEIFSLGATMCFLLTGDVPLAGRARKSGPGERKLPTDVPVPRSVRHLLRQMLRVNPEQRPRDPLLVTDELRACLKKVQRRRPAKVPIEKKVEPEIADEVEAGKAEPKTRPRFLIPILTGATVLLLLAAFGIILLPAQVRWWTRTNRPLESIGVPIGIDESAPLQAKVESVAPPTSPDAESKPSISAKPNDAAPGESDQVVAEQPAISSSPAPEVIATPEPSTAPVIAKNSPAPPPETTLETVDSPANDLPPPATSPPPVAQEMETPLPAEESPAVTPSIAPAEENHELPPPGEGPPPVTTSPPPVVAAEKPAITRQESPSRQNDEPPVTATPSPATTRTAKAVPSNRGRNKAFSRARGLPTMRVNGAPAKRVGVTADGNWVLRLPSGETIIAPPPPDTGDAPIISHRKVHKLPAAPGAVPPDNRPPIVVLPPEN